MANYNFLPKGITPLPSSSDSHNNLSFNLIPEHAKERNQNGSKCKKRQIHDSPAYGPQPEFKTTILEIQNIMKEKKSFIKAGVNTIKNLLDNCYMDDPISTHTDDFGYDLVQRAAAYGAMPILEYLIENGYSLFLNSRKCSTPLYLACTNNNTETVKFLLEHGASISHPCKQCYPKRHNMKVGRKNRRRGSTDGSVVCSQPSSGFSLNGDLNNITPLHTVIRQNQSKLLELLLKHAANSENIDPAELLQYACKKGSSNCFAILMKLYLEKCETYNKPYPDDPLLHQAFMHSEACGVRFLDEAFQLNIEKEVVKEAVEVDEVNILHFIYYLPHIVQFLDITKKIIQAGFDTTNIDRPNSIGESPLHVLLSHVGPKLISRILPCESLQTQDSDPIDLETLESERQKQLFATVRYLISLGADVNLVTQLDESVLHKLIDNVSYHSFGSYVDFGLTVGIKVQPKVNQILEYLLRKGADVNFSNTNVSTVLSKLINTLSMFTPNRLDIIWPHVWYTFNLLFKYKADPNILDNRGISNLSMVLTTLHRWLQTISSQNRDSEHVDSDLPCRVLEKTKDLIWLLFQHGLQPSSNVLELAMKQVAIMSNGIKGENYLDMLRSLLVPFFSHGIDPNTLHIIHEGDNQNPMAPSRLHAQFYLTRAFIIHYDAEDSILQLFQIFMNNLEQEKLNTLLNGIHGTLRRDFEHSVPEQSGCLKQVEQFKGTVRPLKCLARISVVRGLEWQLHSKTPFLPLPKLIQRYICDL